MMTLNGADLAKYEGIIANLRVNELQSLLTHFKSPKLGKKQELVYRCIGLLKSVPHQAEVVRLIDDMSKRSYRPAPYQVPARPANVINNGAMNGVMHGYGGGATMYGAQTAATTQHRTVRGLRPLPLPFYDHVATLMDPVELPSAANPNIKTSLRQTMLFYVPREQTTSLYYRSETKPLPRNEIQLRFFFLNGDWQNKEQSDEFPLNCQVRLDDQTVTLPNIIPTNKPNVEPKRPSRPVNLTPYCQPPREPQGRPHKLYVEWTGDRRVWACGVYIVNRVTSNILRERAAANETKQQSEEATRQIVIRRLGTGDDDGITMDKLKISLLCPLGKIRMALPARCRDCPHLQCFDLDLFLQMNEKRPTWKCAVCSGNAPYNRLIIDGYFQKILKDVGPNVTEVELLKDGGYRTIKEEVLDLSDDDDDDAKPASASKGISVDKPKSTSGGSNVAPPAKKPTFDDDIIVLDSDDDDDVQKAVAASHLTAAEENAKIGSSTPSTIAPATPTTKANTPSSDDSIIILDDDTPPRKKQSDSHVASVPSSSNTPPTIVPAVPTVNSCAQVEGSSRSPGSSAFTFHNNQIPQSMPNSFINPWSNPVSTSANTMLQNQFMNYRNGGQPSMLGRNMMQGMPPQFAYHHMMQQPPMMMNQMNRQMTMPTAPMPPATMQPRPQTSNGQGGNHQNGVTDAMNSRNSPGAVNLAQVLHTLNSGNANQFTNPYVNQPSR